MIDITFPGRPVPWARAMARKDKRPIRTKDGKLKSGAFFTHTRQEKHREALAWLIKKEMQEQGIKQWSGPVALECNFDYRRNCTHIKVWPIREGATKFKDTRADVDNLVKEIAESIEDSGLVKDDAQIAILWARKTK